MDKKTFFEQYNARTHLYGRIGLSLGILMMLGCPFAIGLALNAMPDIPAFWKGFAQVAAVYIKNIIPERMKLKLVLIDSYRGEGEPVRHVIGYPPETAHIDVWRYSPVCCSRVIETVFE